MVIGAAMISVGCGGRYAYATEGWGGMAIVIFALPRQLH
jgi:hypothetical protein